VTWAPGGNSDLYGRDRTTAEVPIATEVGQRRILRWLWPVIGLLRGREFIYLRTTRAVERPGAAASTPRRGDDRLIGLPIAIRRRACGQRHRRQRIDGVRGGLLRLLRGQPRFDLERSMRQGSSAGCTRGSDGRSISLAAELAEVAPTYTVDSLAAMALTTCSPTGSLWAKQSAIVSPVVASRAAAPGRST